MFIITPEDVTMYRMANMKTITFFTKVKIVSKGINTIYMFNMILIILNSDSRHYSNKNYKDLFEANQRMFVLAKLPSYSVMNCRDFEGR
jgi:hypothetical protein